MRNKYATESQAHYWYRQALTDNGCCAKDEEALIFFNKNTTIKSEGHFKRIKRISTRYNTNNGPHRERKSIKFIRSINLLESTGGIYFPPVDNFLHWWIISPPVDNSFRFE